ncbi:MAG: hypothetical protein AAF591_00680 [Verrucomicrobiota bacterium]
MKRPRFLFLLLCFPLSVGADDTLEERPGIPMLKEDFSYESTKAYGLYDEADTAAALPDAWKNIQPLDRFDTTISGALTPAAQIPDGTGGSFDISQPASADLLAALKEEYGKGFGLGWYFLPKEQRYREGPGLTGDELLSDLKNGKFDENQGHPSFTYGFYTTNVTKYYRLYRLSGDPYYLDQIVKYAEGIDWLLANRPQQLIPLERRSQPLSDPVAVIPHEPIALANFWAHANAARLLLECARSEELDPSHPSVQKARQFLATAVKYMASQITADYQDLSPKRGEDPVPFEPGAKTLALQEKFTLPNRAAQIIEYTPWNQTFFYFATLAASCRALEDLQAIEGGSRYQPTIDLYRNIVRAGIWNLEDENICVVRDGVPYFFHMHTPLRDKEPKTRLGFPMFGAEDASHSGSGAWNLPYIWECGEDFGVSPALLAGYTNALVATLDDPATTHKNGKAWPRQHLDSPWYLAASGRENHPYKGTKGRYYTMAAFAPEIVAADRPYARNLRVWEDEKDLRRLYAGHLYRTWIQRRP